MNITLLKSKSHPPGGWSYWCPVGEMEFPGGFAFDQQVAKIRAYRVANPGLKLPADVGSVRHELLQFTFLRLRKRIGLEKALEWFSVENTNDAEIEELYKKKPQSLPSEQPSEPPARLAEIASQYLNGGRILVDWVGDGAVPVSQELAQKRADTCIACPKNEPGNWMDKLAAGIADAVREQVGLKHHLKLTVANEDKLQVCKACRCQLPLKVWVPLDTILDDTLESTMKKLPKACWIKQEAACLP